MKLSFLLKVAFGVALCVFLLLSGREVRAWPTNWTSIEPVVPTSGIAELSAYCDDWTGIGGFLEELFKGSFPASSTELYEATTGPNSWCGRRESSVVNLEAYQIGDGIYWWYVQFDNDPPDYAGYYFEAVRAGGLWSFLPTFPPATTSEPDIFPSYPPDCVFSTTTAPISFSATGWVSIPASNPYTWTGLYVLLNPATSSQSYSFYEALPSLTAGQNFNYSIAVSGVATSSYFITYRLIGDTGTATINFDYHCLLHGIGVVSYFLTWIEISSYEIPEVVEDCSAQSIPDRWLCEIKNLLKRIFLPDQASLNMLSDTLGQFQNRVPFNYINAYKTYAQTLHDATYATSSLSFALLGGPVDLNFSWLSTTGTLATSTPFSLQQLFKWLTTGILLLILVVYLISAGRRIFK